MKQVLLLLGVIAAGGCQTQNPFAAFGPQRVPAPTTSQNPPYYPPTASTASPNGAAPIVASPRISVSAENSAAAASPRTSFVAEPADRDPIRIVDNPAAAARTASAATRNALPANGQPAASAQPGGPGATFKSAPAAAPTGGPQSGYTPEGKSPAFNRTRGLFTAQPAASAPAAGYRSDGAVTPATFVETPMANGQWRAR